MDNYFDGNQKLWNQWTKAHYESEFYDVPAFIQGKSSLDPLDLAEVGDVQGKSLLHLQCHFGKDTLSWGRMGANVTGVDLSTESVKKARVLADKIKQPARFIASNIYDLPDKLDEQFDIVYTSYGVINWLPDIDRWAEICRKFVKPGGFFYIAEYHPFAWVFDEGDAEGLKVSYDYFEKDVLVESADGSYAEPDAEFEQKESYEWAHPMGEILTSLIKAGFSFDFIHEHDFINYKRYSFLEKNEAGFWELPKHVARIPLMFSLRARPVGSSI